MPRHRSRMEQWDDVSRDLNYLDKQIEHLQATLDALSNKLQEMLLPQRREDDD